MPRPRLIQKPRFIGFEVEEEVYEILRRLAYEKGTSLSSVARELLMWALEQLNLVKQSEQQAQQAQQVADPPPAPTVDLVAKLDIEEMLEELNSIERALGNVESVLSRLQNPTPVQVEGFLRLYGYRLAEVLSGAESKLVKIRRRYYKVKREARRSEDIERVAERIYNLNKKLKELNKKLEELKKMVKR